MMTVCVSSRSVRLWGLGSWHPWITRTRIYTTIHERKRRKTMGLWRSSQSSTSHMAQCGMYHYNSSPSPTNSKNYHQELHMEETCMLPSICFVLSNLVNHSCHIVELYKGVITGLQLWWLKYRVAVILFPTAEIYQLVVIDAIFLMVFIFVGQVVDSLCSVVLHLP